MSGDCFGQIVVRRSILQTTSFGYRQHTFDESTARFTLGAKAQLAVDHRRTQRALRRVVGRLDAFDVNEGPQPVAVFVQLAAHPDEPLVAAELAAQQQSVDLFSNRAHVPAESSPTDLAFFVTSPMLKHQFDLTYQIMAEPLDLLVRMVD